MASLRAGRLNKRVTIQSLTRTSDGGGGFTEAWAAIDNGTVWAAVEPLNGRERFEAQQTQANLSYRVTIRYRSDVTAQMQVLYGSKTLPINAVLNPAERGEMLELLCEDENV